MRITHVHIKNFRCFQSLDLPFDTNIILIEGINGTGKTSLLEALHYLCYLRSFRTHLPQELVQFGQDNFFIKARLENGNPADGYDLQVGFSNKKRLVKVNNKSIASYKELLDYYRIVTITEDDLGLIKDGPEERRLFIDQAIMLANPEFFALSKRCKDIVDNRNALLKRGASAESYQLWTEQLWQITQQITHARIEALSHLQEEVRKLINHYFSDEFTITLAYYSKKALCDSYQEFSEKHSSLYHDEQRFGRSLFGAHLDDFMIQFKDTKSKNYASRGQQKLIVLLLKVAQVRRLMIAKGAVILLLDDFMTDFDHGKAQTLLTVLIELAVQLIFTIPTPEGFLQKVLLEKGAAKLKLTN
jgi:DNA replication and repair protein RecF